MGQAGSSRSRDLGLMNSCAHGQDVFGRVGRDWRVCVWGGLPVILLPPCLLRVDPHRALPISSSECDTHPIAPFWRRPQSSKSLAAQTL